MAIEMQMTERGAMKGLSFPDFEEGRHLGELAQQIAGALGTTAHRPEGSSLERLISFEAYPSDFALWWDGFNCELGCSAPCGIDMDAIADRLIASSAFAFV